MRPHRPSGCPPAFLLSAIVLVAMPGSASALGHRHRPKVAHAPPPGYAAPIQDVFQYPGTIVRQPTSPLGYAAPIQDVFQYPAAIVNQPGALPPPVLPGWPGADCGYAVPRR